MINLLRILAVTFLVFIVCAIPRANSKEGLDNSFFDASKKISMDFQLADLNDILKIFSIQSGMNFIASESVRERKISLYLDQVSVKEAMDKIFKANNLEYDLDDESNIFIVKDLGKPAVETKTKVFYLKYHSVPSSNIKKDLENNLQSISTSTSTTAETSGSSDTGTSIVDVVSQVLSETGKISEDARSNSLIVTDVPNRFPFIEEIIARLDIPQPQVMLEVEMLDVSKNTVDKMGFNVTGMSRFAITVAGAARSTQFPLASFMPDIASNLTEGIVSFPYDLTAAVGFLRTQSDTKYLARPSILTMNNEPAEIRITTLETVGQETVTNDAGAGGTTTTSAERMETGVSLRITPQVNIETGEVTMYLYPSVKDTTTSTLSGVTAKDPEERSTKSVVRVMDGDTVILGGLIRREVSNTVIKIPILGDIPLLGALFRGNIKDKDRDRELLVFITPRIVKDTHFTLAQASSRKVNIPQREQNRPYDTRQRYDIIESNLDKFKKPR
ncbi:MAG: secretin N-terminal domain-containing protein [Candidatus Omnitrophota bacterium]|nr:hypothetical protein [Candidatus Omnitrophota bacterium]